jgi:large repetitive protein
MKFLALAWVLALAPTAPAQKWFDAPLLLTHQNEVRALGDLDGDGDVDLLSFYGATSSGIWISFEALSNDGTGSFTSGPSTALPSGQLNAVYRPRLGDVTGDGILDLVVTVLVNPTTGPGIRMYPGLPGATFGASVFTSLPGNPRDLVLRDQDGNGALDVGVVHYSGGLDPAVRWLFWNGTGFTASASLLLPGFSALSIASSDVTADGVPDLLVGEWFGPNVRVIPTAGGNPTLGPLVPIAGPVGDGRSLLVGDLEGDGDEDVLVWTEDYLTGLRLVVVENGGGGTFTVGSTQFFSQASFPFFSSHAADLGDWDGDGDLDLFRQSEILTFFSNDGSNSFSFEAAVPTDYDAAGAGPADFDGDGALDFCAARALKFGNGTFHSVLLPPVGSYGPTAAKAIDWEGDGDVDFLDTFGQALLNDGTGSFSLTPSLWPAPPASNIYRDPVALADFDGDGRADYLAARFLIILVPPMTPAQYQDMRLLRDDGVGGYVDAGIASAGAQIPPEFNGQMRRPAVDIDGDGDLDLLDGGFYRANNGAGFFSPPVFLYTGNAVDAGDVDGDGDLDVLTSVSVGSSPISLVVQTDQGGLVFTGQTLFTSSTQDARARFLDLEGDGDLDVALGAGPSGNQLRLFENVGGSFVLPPVSLFASPFTTQVVGTGDLDGDGLLDVVTGPFDVNPNGSWMNAYRRVGPGLVYEPRREYMSRLVRDFPDLDGDGDTDVSGAALAYGWNFEGPSAGRIRQYGLGTAGAGGARPVLGGTGPVRPGSATASVRLRRGLGGTAALLVVGTAETALPNTPFPGITAYVGGTLAFVPFVAQGAPGVAGDGRIDIPIPVPLLATLANTSVFLEIFLIDPAAASFLTATNGLEVQVGT